MRQREARVARAIGGIVVFVVLAWVVGGYIGEYRDSTGGGEAAPAESATTTAPPAETGGEQPESEPTSPAEDSATGKGSVIVLIDGLNLRREAKTDSPTLGGLKEGDRLTLIGQVEGWYEVETANGSRGWVSANPAYVKTEEQ